MESRPSIICRDLKQAQKEEKTEMKRQLNPDPIISREVDIPVLPSQDNKDTES